MNIRYALLGAAALLSAATTAVQAQPGWVPPGNDPGGYYSDSDHNGYYDRNGRYNRIQDRGPPPPPPDAYQQGRYETDCHRGNQAAGTIFGALAGGLIGGAASHGNGGAVLGGLLGNTIRRDIDCDDQSAAFGEFSVGLNGDIGRRYDWRGRNGYGYFTPTREFRRGGVVCRDFTETTYRGGREYTRTGTACRQTDGNWRFD